MRSVRVALALVALLIAAPSHAAPTEIVPGAQYEAGTQIGVHALGVSFVVPQGWFGGLPPGGEAVLLGSNTQAGLVMVAAELGKTMNDARSWLSTPQNLDGLMLTPSRTPTVSGTRARGSFTAHDGTQPLAAEATVVAAADTTLLILAIGPATETKRLRGLADGIAASSRVTGPPKPSAGIASALCAQYFSYSGNTTRWLDLCPDGRLRYRDESSFSGDFTGAGGEDLGGWGAHGKNAVTGTWSATGSWQSGNITFNWEHGESYTHAFRAVDHNCIEIKNLTWCKRAAAECP